MARQQVIDAVKAGGFGSREVFIRINGVETPWHADDLSAAAHAAPDAILVPKVSNPDTLEMIGRRLLDMHSDHKIRIWAMIETPLAIFNILPIAAEAKDSESRLSGFVMGTNDLAKDTRARLVPGRAPMLGWLSMCLAAARTYGIDILDGVYNDIGNAEGFAMECRQGVELGFDGKTLIHPNQIEPCNMAFSPSAEDVAQARKIIAAFDLPENKAKGVVSIEGRMVERLHADMARRTVAIAEAITARQ
jgi:citrate lyase subunit beta/citryl-CoA lyase